MRKHPEYPIDVPIYCTQLSNNLLFRLDVHSYDVSLGEISLTLQRLCL